MRGPYGEVLRASTAISATEPSLGAELAQAFGRPALIDIHARLAEAVRDGQISENADLDATIDLLMAIIVFVGATLLSSRSSDPASPTSRQRPRSGQAGPEPVERPVEQRRTQCEKAGLRAIPARRKHPQLGIMWVIGVKRLRWCRGW